MEKMKKLTESQEATIIIYVITMTDSNVNCTVKMCLKSKCTSMKKVLVLQNKDDRSKRVVTVHYSRARLSTVTVSKLNTKQGIKLPL